MISLDTPVALFAFNRPDLTIRVFERIREARPSRLYLVCDGPRSGRPDDIDRVDEVRKILNNVDWSCEVFRNFSETNLGCRRRVASGLNWVFENEEEAIILEDDTLPDPSFFSFCEELLERFRNDVRVMHVGGTNLAASYQRIHGSFRFSHHASIWGWATWKRAWRLYDLEMTTWDDRVTNLRQSFASSWERHYWMSMFVDVRQKAATIDTWDFAWNYTCRSCGGLCILPARNLVENIGFGEHATHTTVSNPRLRPLVAPYIPSDYPKKVVWDRYGDAMLTRVCAGQTLGFFGRLRARLGVWRERSRRRFEAESVGLAVNTSAKHDPC